MPGQCQMPDGSLRQPRAVAQHAGERLGVEVVGGPPRRALTDRGHQSGQAPRPRCCQRLSLPPRVRLVQCGRQLGAHRPGLVHHGAEHVEQQGLNVIRSDHPPIVPPALPASTPWRTHWGRSGPDRWQGHANGPD